MNSPETTPYRAEEPRQDDQTGLLRARRDIFYGGRFAVHQPDGWGFRSGHDALLLAASVPADARGRLADIGSGCGVVALAAATRAPGVEATLVEKNAAMVELANRSLADPANADLASRLAVIGCDIFMPRAVREPIGLADAVFDIVVTNPPFHPARGRAAVDVSRAEAMVAGGATFLLDWVRACLKLLRHGGQFSILVRTDALVDVLTALQDRAGGARIVPIHPSVRRGASRILVSARKGSREPLAVMPSRFLRDADGLATDFERRIGVGEADLTEA